MNLLKAQTSHSQSFPGYVGEWQILIWEFSISDRAYRYSCPIFFQMSAWSHLLSFGFHIPTGMFMMWPICHLLLKLIMQSLVYYCGHMTKDDARNAATFGPVELSVTTDPCSESSFLSRFYCSMYPLRRCPWWLMGVLYMVCILRWNVHTAQFGFLQISPIKKGSHSIILPVNLHHLLEWSKIKYALSSIEVSSFYPAYSRRRKQNLNLCLGNSEVILGRVISKQGIASVSIAILTQGGNQILPHSDIMVGSGSWNSIKSLCDP